MPLDVFEFAIMTHDCCLCTPQRVHNAVVHMTLLGEQFHFLRGLLKWLHDLFVCLFLVELLLLLHGVLLPSIRELILELLDDIKVSVRNLLIVLLDLLVLLGVFLG